MNDPTLPVKMVVHCLRQNMSSGAAFCFRLNHILSSPPLLSLSIVSHIPGLCGGCRPRPQPAVSGRLPELFVLLPQRWRGGEQEAQLLLRHLVRRGCWPHHMVRESSRNKRCYGWTADYSAHALSLLMSATLYVCFSVFPFLFLRCSGSLFQGQSTSRLKYPKLLAVL